MGDGDRVSGADVRAGWRRPQLAHEAVAQELRRRIRDGRYGPGHKLRQERLAEEFGVSRAPLREALRLLESESLLVHRRHIGYEVVALRREDLDEIQLMRSLLEDEALRLAVPRLTNTDIAELERLLADLHGPSAFDDAEQGNSLHEQFHLLIFRRAGSPRLQLQVERFWRSAHLFRAAAYKDSSGWSHTADGHMALLNACRRHDVEAALAAMRAHRLDTFNRLVAILGDS